MADKRQLERILDQINNLRDTCAGDDDFLEVESFRPGDVRFYQITSHRGSNNISLNDTIDKTCAYADGMLYALRFFANKK
jgi:hypothetical protein